MIKIDKSGYTILCDSKPYPEFNELQKLAIEEGQFKATIDNRDSYFITVVIDGIPSFSFTSILVTKDILRVVTKLYANPNLKDNISRSILFSCFDIFDSEHFDHIKLQIVSRHPSLTRWKSFFHRRGFTVDEDNLYLMGRDKKKQTSWKQLYYKGDINYLGVEKMSQKKYESLFGQYKFTQSWSDPAIENAKSILTNPQKVLEIGTFEGKFSIWLAETYKCDVTTIDPFDGSVYGVSQSLFDEAHKNCITNLNKCKQKIHFIHKKSHEALYDLRHQTFDFIYIDGSHRSAEVLEDLVMSYRLLSKGGIIMLDDSVYWKARKHITNELIQDVTESPRMAVDSFIHIHWKDIEVLKLANNYQTAFKKLI